MRNIINIIQNQETPVVEVQTSEDVISDKLNNLLSDLEEKIESGEIIVSKDTAKTPSDVLPKKTRDVKAAYSAFMTEDDVLDEGRLRDTAVALGLGATLATGGMAHNHKQAKEAEAAAQYAKQHPPKRIGDHVFGGGDWAYDGGQLEEPEDEKPVVKHEKTFFDKINPFYKEKPTQTVDPSASQRKIDANYLAATIWGEARNQGYEGMNAVGHVIKNRMEKGRWGETIKDVVLNRKQFSCWNEGDPNVALIKHMQEIDNYIKSKPEGFEQWLAEFKTSNDYREYQEWRRAKQIAADIMNGKSDDVTNGALYYHTTGVNPIWNKGQKVAAQIGDHLFYKTSWIKPDKKKKA